MADYEHPAREGREASYYELALSNRQVFFAVVVLLVGLTGAFLTGVWFARSSAPAPRAARAAPVEPAVKETVGEYNFFSEKEKAAVPRAAATPAAQRPAARDAAPTGAESAPAKALQTDAAAAATTSTPSMTSAPVGTSAPRPASEPGSTAAPADAKAGGDVAAPGTDLFVQVFSSADIAQAKRVVGQLQRVGYQGFIAPLANVNGQTLHRVRVGPYRQRELAQKAADAIRQKLKFSTWITNTQ